MANALAARLSVLEGRRRPAHEILGVLSAREREVFCLASDCMLAREMTLHLRIARKTVDTHLNRINRKLGLRNMADLVRLAASLRMLGARSSSEASSGSRRSSEARATSSISLHGTMKRESF